MLCLREGFHLPARRRSVAGLDGLFSAPSTADSPFACRPPAACRQTLHEALGTVDRLVGLVAVFDLFAARLVVVGVRFRLRIMRSTSSLLRPLDAVMASSAPASAQILRPALTIPLASMSNVTSI